MRTVRSILANTTYQLVGKVLSTFITVFVTYLIAQSYGSAGYGEFNLMQNWPALFFVIVDFGFNAIAVREISKNEELAQKYLSTILVLRSVLIFAVLAFVSIALMFFPYSSALKLGIGLSLLLIITQSMFATANIVFQARHRYDLSTLGVIIGYLVILMLVTGLYYVKAPIMLISFSYVLGGLVTGLVNFNSLGKFGLKIAFIYDKKLANYLLSEALPLGFMFIFSQINFKVDAILLSVLDVPAHLGHFAKNELVGIYGLAYKVFEVALVVPTFLMNSIYPVLVRHQAEGRQKFASSFFKTMVALVGAGVLCGVVGVLLAPFAINVLSGGDPAFSSSIVVLQVLLAGLVLYFITQPLAWLIVILNGQKHLVLVYLISAVFNVCMNLLLIPRFSFFASMFITHASELVILILLLIIARKSWKKTYA